MFRATILNRSVNTIYQKISTISSLDRAEVFAANRLRPFAHALHEMHGSNSNQRFRCRRKMNWQCASSERMQRMRACMLRSNVALDSRPLGPSPPRRSRRGRFLRCPSLRRSREHSMPWRRMRAANRAMSPLRMNGNGRCTTLRTPIPFISELSPLNQCHFAKDVTPRKRTPVRPFRKHWDHWGLAA